MYELNNNVRSSPSTSVCDPVLARDYVNAVVPWVKNNATMISPMNNMRSWTADNKSTKQLPYTKIGTGLVWGLGVSYDSLGGQGEDFTTQQFGMNLELDLTSDNPVSTFVFVNSEQSIFFNQNGLRVVQ